MEQHVYNEVSVGIDPKSEWKPFFELVKRNGDNWVAGDYKNFDCHINIQIVDAVCDLIDTYYDDGHSLLRRTLVRSMFNTYRLANKTLYRVVQGLPSGFPMTAIFNSLANGLFLRMAYYSVRPEGVTDEFSNCCTARCYGDDHIVRVSNDAPWFNMISIRDYLSEHAFVYTDPEKGEITTEYLDEFRLTYLKRDFPHGRLPLKLVMDFSNWYRENGEDPHVATSINLEAMMSELSLFGEKVFENVKAKLNVICSKQGIRVPTLTYKQALKQPGNYE
jgi:hypothetical protein